MDSIFYDRVLETTTTTGTGTYTLAGAVAGHRSFSVVGNGLTTPVAVWEVDANGNPSGAWEVARGCVWSSSGTTLTRGTFVASSTGSAINWASGTKRVAQVLPAEVLQAMANLAASATLGCRLTLTQGSPVTTGDVTGATTIYVEPWLGDTLPMYRDASGDIPIRPKLAASSVSLALGTLASATIPNDVFIDYGVTSAGVLSLTKVPWTSTSARATALVASGGHFYKSGDLRYLWLGTFAPTSTTTTADSAANRYLANGYRSNQVPKHLGVSESTSHTINNTAAREWNGGTAARVNFVCPLVQGAVSGEAVGAGNFGAGTTGYLNFGCGLNSTTYVSGFTLRAGTPAAQFDFRLTATQTGMPTLGLNYFTACENEAASATVTLSSVIVRGVVPC